MEQLIERKLISEFYNLKKLHLLFDIMGDISTFVAFRTGLRFSGEAVLLQVTHLTTPQASRFLHSLLDSNQYL